MILGGAALFLVAFLISLIGTGMARRFARRLGLMDDPGHRKVHTVATPRNGGIGIFWGIALPLLVGMGVARLMPAELMPQAIADFVKTYGNGMRAHMPLAMVLLGATFLIHLLGLADDRKAMAPWPKLLAQVAIALLLVAGGEVLEPGAFRVLTFLGKPYSVGFFASVIVSVMWIVALTNAFNFLDNMDGLSAGVAFLCAGTFMIAAFFNGQWFIAAMLLTFMGAVLGFLCFNFPPASIFMGDGGSMVLGFLLSALTIRTTYYTPERKWYSVLMPLFVMAVPLYDLSIVSVLRLSRGRSPMQGDTNHFSHRLTRHGFSKRGAVLVIYALTLAIGITAPLLSRTTDDTSAVLMAVQLLAMLVVIAILERVGEHTQ
jgi:UDP-GlcNAc:undecaprenyl-phosphate GlcNAc-1-phosphate transferase